MRDLLAKNRPTPSTEQLRGKGGGFQAIIRSWVGTNSHHVRRADYVSVFLEGEADKIWSIPTPANVAHTRQTCRARIVDERLGLPWRRP